MANPQSNAGFFFIVGGCAAAAVLLVTLLVSGEIAGPKVASNGYKMGCFGSQIISATITVGLLVLFGVVR